MLFGLSLLLLLLTFLLLNTKIPLSGSGTLLVSRRFPKYGTHEFAQQCSWAYKQQPNKDPLPDCNLLLRMRPGGSEGIADWISMAASGFLLSKQTGCHFFMEYYEGVDIHQVLSHVSTNWTIPHGFQCLQSNNCVKVTTWTATQFVQNRSLLILATRLGRKVVDVPYYRHAYIHTPAVYPTIFQDLEKELEGFTLENGMACSLGSLFDLSPTASQFESDLFTRILPTLRDERNLVVALYIRSGHTDKAFKAERDGKALDEKAELYQMMAKPCLKCALRFEEQSLSEASSSYSKVVWMLVTDSAYLKQWISDSYDTADIKLADTAQPGMTSDVVKEIPRVILSTTSRGVQTRTSRNPSTVDFAEALIDWYLIGESDVVVVSSLMSSFGATAALRTMRPLYEWHNCSQPRRFGPPLAS